MILGFPVRFHGGQFRGLIFRYGDAFLIAAYANQDNEDQGLGRDHLESGAEKFRVGFAEQMPGGKSQDKESRQGPGGQDCMRELSPGEAVEHDIKEAA